MKLRNVEYKNLVAVAFLFGIFMDLMDLTIVNVALPTLGRQFHAGSTTLEWVVTGYLLSLAIWIPASGWIGDRFGTKKTYMFALAMFTLASALCGLAWNIESLIAFRILQGVGGGMMTPVATAMLFRAFPPAERAKAATVMTIPTVIAPAIGPVLGGWLVDDVSWHWIFYVNLPIGMLGLLFTALFIREHTEEKAGAFDFWGFFFSGAGLALVLYALSQAPENGWTSPKVLGTGIAGVIAFVLLVIVELRHKEPMLDLRLFSDRLFRNTNIVFFTSIGGLLGVLFLLPLFLQNLRGISAIETGLILLPQALGVIMLAPLVGKLYPIIGPRRLIAVSMILFAFTSSLFLLVDLQTSMWWVAAIMLGRGWAMAFTFIPLQAATFARIKPQDTGRASALFNTNRQVASSFGVAILATVLAERTKHYTANASGAAIAHGSLMGFHDAFFVAALLSIIGFVFVFMINDADAAPSMQPSGEISPEDAPVPVHV